MPPSRPYTVEHVRPLTADVFVIRTERQAFRMRTGQHVTLGPHGSGVNREYSVYSGEEDPYLEFLLKIRPGSVIGRTLRTYQAGDQIDISGPFGDFTLPNPRDTSQRYLFIATGVGIAPFHSFVRSYPSLDYHLIHGVRCVSDGYDAGHYAADRYTPCTSQDPRGAFQGRVTAFLEDYRVKPGTLCYICGNSRMISEVYDLLRSKDVDSNNLYTEVFN